MKFDDYDIIDDIKQIIYDNFSTYTWEQFKSDDIDTDWYLNYLTYDEYLKLLGLDQKIEKEDKTIEIVNNVENIT